MSARTRENLRGTAMITISIVGALVLVAAIAILAFALFPTLIVFFAAG